jgi:FkbM family methyltransferase
MADVSNNADRRELVADYFIKRMILLLRQREEDNFDYDRFGSNNDQNYEFDVGRHRAYFYFLLQHFPAISAAYAVFEDEASCALYKDLIEYRLVGHHHKRLPTHSVHYQELRQKTLALESVPSPFAAQVMQNGLGLPLETVFIPFQGKTLAVDCWKLGCLWAYFLNQYFFERDGVRIAPEPGDHVIDGGVFHGDMAVRMAAEVGTSGYVYGFDPVDFHCDLAAHNTAANAAGSAPTKIFRCGLSDADVDGAKVSIKNLMPGYRLESGIATRSIDSLVRAGEIERVDFIKLDVEGSEMAALRGAVATMERFRPKLAISLYHNERDLFKIPLYLSRTLPDYEFYLDHYTIHAEETVLYARPKK